MGVSISSTRGVNIDIRSIVSFPEFVETGVPFSCELNLYNRSGLSISRLSLYACANYDGINSAVRIADSIITGKLANGTSKTVRFECNISDPTGKLGSGHVLSGISYFLFSSDFFEPPRAGYSYLQNGDVLHTRYNPHFDVLSAVRYDQAHDMADDESSNVRMILQCASDDIMPLTIRFFENGIEDASRMVSVDTAASYDLDTYYTMSSGSNWEMVIRFGDAFEWIESVVSVPRAFANLHLSGAANGGVAFGKFSASTDENPMTESVYPIYPYGGIAGLEYGTISVGSIASEKTASAAITFAHTMPDMPAVIVTADTGDTTGNVKANVNNVTTNGFTIYARNDGTQAKTVKVHWIAFALPTL